MIDRSELDREVYKEKYCAPEKVAKEVDDGRKDLVQDQKAHTEHLKAGGRSGISHEFGKPMICDDGQTGSPNDTARRTEIPESAGPFTQAEEEYNDEKKRIGQTPVMDHNPTVPRPNETTPPPHPHHRHPHDIGPFGDPE